MDGAADQFAKRPPVAIPGKTGRRPWSTQLLREWAAIKYGRFALVEQVRLGPTSESVVGVPISPAMAAALRVWNWYADGLIVTDTEALIIEAKVHPEAAAVGQVLFYRTLMLSTPALASVMNRQWIPVVLYAESDPDVTRFAIGLGCRVEIYTPTWIEDYLNQVQFRRRSAPSTALSTAPTDQLSTVSTVDPVATKIGGT